MGVISRHADVIDVIAKHAAAAAATELSHPTKTPRYSAYGGGYSMSADPPRVSSNQERGAGGGPLSSPRHPGLVTNNYSAAAMARATADALLKFGQISPNGPSLRHEFSPGPGFTQTQLDMVLYGYARSGSTRSDPGHAISGIKSSELSYGRFRLL